MTASTSAGNITTGTPAVVIFDVNETLSDMAPLAASFDRVGLGSGAVEAWFAGVLRDGFALTALGVNPSFAEIASEALRVRLAMARGTGDGPSSGAESAQQSVEEVMGTFNSLTVHPDVAEGVQALGGLGARLVTLSNGSAAVAQGLFERAGLSAAFEALMTVEDAGAWKPHPAAYAYALDRCGVSASDAMLVAVHPWDIDGAARAGLRTGWLNRKRVRYPGYMTAPDFEATDLVQLARLLS